MKNLLIGIIAFACIQFKGLGQVDTLSVFSKAMNKNLKAAVVTPQNYESSGKAYPTVYVLHGAWGSFSDWHKKITEPDLLLRLATQYEVILVTPGVAPFSFYYDSPLMDSVRYETYLTKELIPYIDLHYRTIPQKEARAITGLSMGGHGAMMLSAKNPELFIAAGSMSGVMNIDARMWKIDEKSKNQRFKDQGDMLGSINYDAPFSPYTAVGLVDRMKENGIALIIDCGVEDFLIETNRQIHQLLLANGTPHEYIEKPGAHTWEYWTEALPVHFLFIDKVFKKSLATSNNTSH